MKMNRPLPPLSTSSTHDEIGDAAEALKQLVIGTAGLSLECEAEADDEADDELENDIDRPLTDFERTHPELLTIFRRNSSIFTGPEVAVDRVNAEKPSEFFRVCDEETFIKFNHVEGFINEAVVDEVVIRFPAWPFVNADSVVDHINWAKDSSRFSISHYISMCSTTTKRDNEMYWRQKRGRLITVFRIDGHNLAWGRIRLTPMTWIDCLFRRGTTTTNSDIVFISAEHLIKVFCISDRIKKETALRGAKDEWLAVQRIPLDMITELKLPE